MSVRTSQRDGDRRVAGRGTGRGTGRGLSSARERFEDRAARVRRRPLRLLAIVAAVVVVVALAAWVLLASSFLSVRTVTVTGLTDARERAAVSAAADVPLGTPLARVDTAGAARRVSAIATVGSVEVVRSWPHTVTVVVSRKVAVLAVRTPDGTVSLVGDDGRGFKTVATAPAGLPVITSSTATPDPDGIRAAISVLQILPAALRATVSGVTVTSADLVTFQLGAVTVTWGGVADGPKKLRVLQTLLGTSPKTIDVSAPDTPTTT